MNANRLAHSNIKSNFVDLKRRFQDIRWSKRSSRSYSFYDGNGWHFSWIFQWNAYWTGRIVLEGILPNGGILFKGFLQKWPYTSELMAVSYPFYNANVWYSLLAFNWHPYWSCKALWVVNMSCRISLWYQLIGMFSHAVFEHLTLNSS